MAVHYKFSTGRDAGYGYDDEDGGSRFGKKWSNNERERRDRKDMSDAIAGEFSRRHIAASLSGGSTKSTSKINDDASKFSDVRI